MHEEALTGGNSTVVVRVGDTVRRTAGPWTESVRRLLATLRAAGLTEVPEHFGLDERGREVLAFLPGEVPTYPLPAWVWEPGNLAAAGSLLRRMHDASVALVGEAAEWQLPSHEPVEVICHNDVAPYNMVFDDGHLVGLIDFDTASPGPRIWDLAYLAYQLVPFTSADGGGSDLPARFARLDALIEAYGHPFTLADVLRVAVDRLADLAIFTEHRAADTGRGDFLDHAAVYRSDRAHLLTLTTQVPSPAPRLTFTGFADTPSGRGQTVTGE